MKNLTLIALSVIGFSINCSAGLNPIKIITAPITAPFEVANDLVHGKTPDATTVVSAVDPTVAQIVETDRQTGISDDIKNLAELPKSANEAAKTAKQTADTATAAINEIRPMFPGFKAAVGGLQNDADSATQQFGTFLATISVPAQFVLWSLTLLIMGKIFRFLFPKPVKR
jgi:hypothetical protein